MDQLIGTVLGNHRILKKIGEGGMGAVYQARDLSLEREVAIKVIAPELARTPGLMARFRIEAIAQAKLNHPHIVTIHSFDEEKKIYYIVMELVEGRDLKTVIKEKGAFPMEEALKIFLQILRGIGYAHSKGVIHRDIKSSNIYLTTEHSAKVGDFGIAKVDDIDGLTRVGTTLGSPVYSSPEQLMGKSVDARTDIYSLGITLYEMITGALPFKKTGGSAYAEVKQTVEIIPPVPSSLNPSVPAAIDAIVMKSIAKDAGERYPDVNGFKQAIKAMTGLDTPLPAPAQAPPDEKAAAANLNAAQAAASPARLKNAPNRKLIVTTVSMGIVLVVLVLILLLSSPATPPSNVQSNSNNSSSPLPQSQGNSVENMPSSISSNPNKQPGSNNNPSNTTNNPQPQPSQPQPSQPQPQPPSLSDGKTDTNTGLPGITSGGTLPVTLDKMSRLIRQKYYNQAISTGTKAVNNGIVSGELYQKLAQALYYSNKKNLSWHYCMKAFETGSSLYFGVRYRYKKETRVTGTLAIGSQRISFNPRSENLSSYAFSVPISQVRKTTTDITSKFTGLLKKKKNRKNPALTIHHRRKRKYELLMTTNDTKLRNFIEYIIDTLKKK
ncbi:MAG: serine/threonine protein kinase [bacterium]|nr:serine/threonine protein kinase [bacterium]